MRLSEFQTLKIPYRGNLLNLEIGKTMLPNTRLVQKGDTLQILLTSLCVSDKAIPTASVEMRGEAFLFPLIAERRQMMCRFFCRARGWREQCARRKDCGHDEKTADDVDADAADDLGGHRSCRWR